MYHPIIDATREAGVAIALVTFNSSTLRSPSKEKTPGEKSLFEKTEKSSLQRFLDQIESHSAVTGGKTTLDANRITVRYSGPLEQPGLKAHLETTFGKWAVDNGYAKKPLTIEIRLIG